MTEVRPSKGARRIRRLALVAAVLGVVAAVRWSLLARDQRAFEDRYGPSRDGSHPG